MNSLYTDKQYIKFLYKCFYDLHNILVKNNITYFASGGTLLGAVRHEGIIPWDDDVDIEISYKDIPRIFELEKVFLSKGYKIVKFSESKNDLDWIKINSIKKVDGRRSSIDIFPIYIKDGRTYHYSKYTQSIWSNYYHVIQDIYPLRQLPFGDGVVICVNKPKPYLNLSYGKNWSKIGYITMDADHYMLDEPIEVTRGNFEAGKNFASAKKQILLEKDDNILTGKGILFL
jgi:hypothetical protein